MTISDRVLKVFDKLRDAKVYDYKTQTDTTTVKLNFRGGSNSLNSVVDTYVDEKTGGYQLVENPIIVKTLKTLLPCANYKQVVTISLGVLITTQLTAQRHVYRVTFLNRFFGDKFVARVFVLLDKMLPYVSLLKF